MRILAGGVARQEVTWHAYRWSWCIVSVMEALKERRTVEPAGYSVEAIGTRSEYFLTVASAAVNVSELSRTNLASS